MFNVIKRALVTALIVTSLQFTSFQVDAANRSADNKTQAVAVDFLVGSDDITGIRLAYRPYKHQWHNVPFFDTLDVYWEMSVNFWEHGSDNQHDVNYAIALSPVVGKTFHYVNGVYPLKWEVGIGVSLLADTEFAGKDVGSHYQFEDRIGLTMEFGKDLGQSISLRYLHYSNGGLNSKNPGLDFLNLAYAFSF